MVYYNQKEGNNPTKESEVVKMKRDVRVTVKTTDNTIITYTLNTTLDHNAIYRCTMKDYFETYGTMDNIKNVIITDM